MLPCLIGHTLSLDGSYKYYYLSISLDIPHNQKKQAPLCSCLSCNIGYLSSELQVKLSSQMENCQVSSKEAHIR